jgi:hypothetical protein
VFDNITTLQRENFTKMDHRLPGPNSNIAENIKQAKEKVIQVYDMLPNFCSNEGIH